jgi:hypothetical protein
MYFIFFSAPDGPLTLFEQTSIKNAINVKKDKLYQVYDYLTILFSGYEIIAVELKNKIENNVFDVKLFIENVFNSPKYLNEEAQINDLPHEYPLIVQEVRKKIFLN